MSGKEKDVDEGIDFSEKAFKKRFKRTERPAFVDRILQNNPASDSKSRITIYLDADIVTRFKKTAQKEGTGYQTLINNALRRIVDSEQKEAEKENLKNELLKDKQFLRELKTA